MSNLSIFCNRILHKDIDKFLLFTSQVEELRRKYSARIQEQEEQIETLLVKINNLEKQKSRLQSEVEVLIIDLEKVMIPLLVLNFCEQIIFFTKISHVSFRKIFYTVVFLFFFQANGTARELQKRVEHLEKINIELKTRLDESLALYEQSQRDLRNKQQELQRVNAELDKTRELKDQLARENKKLGGNVHRFNDSSARNFNLKHIFDKIWIFLK